MKELIDHNIKMMIPKRFQACEFETYVADTADKKKVLSVCMDYSKKCLKTGNMLLLCGNVGTGKNHLVCSIIKELIRKRPLNLTIYMESFLKTMGDVKKSWGNKEFKSPEKAIREADLVVINEIGVQFQSETEQKMFFDFVNYRYEQMKPMVFTSNLTQIELKDVLGERVWDRFTEVLIAVNLNWDSYRKEKREV